jgi:hypothetical protein
MENQNMHTRLAFTAVAFISFMSMDLAYGGGVTVATLTGRCTKVTAMNTSTDPALCSNKVMNMEYPNGRNGFTFVLTAQDGSSAAISFSGKGSRQTHQDKDHVTQPIDRVMFTFSGSTDNLKATGACSFANPYKRTPVKISCAANTNKGIFSGEFISNGVSPDVDQI